MTIGFGYRASIDEHETTMLRLMRRWCGLLSYSQIAAKLNDAGYLTRRGRSWTKASVGFHLRPAARQYP